MKKLYEDISSKVSKTSSSILNYESLLAAGKLRQFRLGPLDVPARTNSNLKDSNKRLVAFRYVQFDLKLKECNMDFML